MPVSAQEYVPAGKQSIAALCAAAELCKGCNFYERATQTVLSEGKSTDTSPSCSLGNNRATQKIRTGHPFIGPAETLLDQALRAIGVS
jgi:uracil-DNA glycosylase